MAFAERVQDVEHLELDVRPRVRHQGLGFSRLFLNHPRSTSPLTSLSPPPIDPPGEAVPPLVRAALSGASSG